MAATNHNLDQLVEEGRFRRDLYYRLKVITIKVPPLRDRLDDVPELAHYFLFRNDRELNLDFRGFAPETIARLQAYRWPGNVRELQSVIKHAMISGVGHVVLAEFLPKELREDAGIAPARATNEFPSQALLDYTRGQLARGEANMLAKAVEAVERVLLPAVLNHVRGHQGQASELLGINRATLRTKMKALGIAVDRTVTDEPSV
jgi:two-component system nitrogen regulation response regulator GlnG